MPQAPTSPLVQSKTASAAILNPPESPTLSRSKSTTLYRSKSTTLYRSKSTTLSISKSTSSRPLASPYVPPRSVPARLKLRDPSFLASPCPTPTALYRSKRSRSKGVILSRLKEASTTHLIWFPPRPRSAAFRCNSIATARSPYFISPFLALPYQSVS